MIKPRIIINTKIDTCLLYCLLDCYLVCLLSHKKRNSRKSVRWSAVPVAPVSVCGCVMVRGAAAPKGPMTYAVSIVFSLKVGSWD